MPEVIFTVPGKPQGKGRPRFVTKGKGGKTLPFPMAYTPKKTKDYESHIRTCFLEQTGKMLRLDCPVYVAVEIHMPIPKSTSKTRRNEMLDGEKPVRKPDADNVIKAVLDALNGYAWNDDNQVYRISAKKSYAESPMLIVGIRWGEQ